ncbi:hypothetical protein [Lentzea aerocolonigenes]|uniref:hypothetical protein n=1 Tax=Lentzea aerocolonigenes TaxID=68170 RepID=UPI0004C3F365|nr:hypothetical protein [Lentzea aerocolonigenes]MCP2247607.1 hypothetical protein [Lentzea aerocolonigenes]
MPYKFRKAAIALAAVALTAVVAPPASATTALADCTARLNPLAWQWTAQCTAPHKVTIRSDRRWYWLHQPGIVYTTTSTSTREVVPGTPWNGWILPLPESVTVTLCLTAYQDSTLLIAPTTCYGRWP